MLAGDGNLALDLDRLRGHMAGAVARQWGERVRARRDELGLTQQQLADLVGVPFQTISKIERGEIAPRDYLRAAIAVRLAQDIEQLFPWPPRGELQDVAS